MKHPAIKHTAVRCAAVLAVLMAGATAHAASYEYDAHYTSTVHPKLFGAQADAELQEATRACDGIVGVQVKTPTADYRSCMRQHGWQYNFVTRERVQTPRAPADPYFSTNVKVAPGHFIDHDNGMDCVNTGGAEVCDPPNGTVHYFDPDQNLPCTRTGASAICSNM